MPRDDDGDARPSAASDPEPATDASSPELWEDARPTVAEVVGWRVWGPWLREHGPAGAAVARWTLRAVVAGAIAVVSVVVMPSLRFAGGGHPALLDLALVAGLVGGLAASLQPVWTRVVARIAPFWLAATAVPVLALWWRSVERLMGDHLLGGPWHELLGASLLVSTVVLMAAVVEDEVRGGRIEVTPDDTLPPSAQPSVAERTARTAAAAEREPVDA